MTDLLKIGPYEVKELTVAQKQNLIKYVLGCEDDTEDSWDLDIPWYISNNPLDDSEWDGRDKFWARGEEYPYPYAILIGGNTGAYHYDSISKNKANELGIFLSR